MLTELCQELKNWFDKARFFGYFTIHDGILLSSNDGDMGILDGQYYRIIGSVFNDGVQKHGSEELKDEDFDGAVWLMAVPPAVISLADEITAWTAKYGSLDSQAMSPYSSESFAGYSYSKSQGSNGKSGNGWASVFADSLNRWRKI